MKKIAIVLSVCTSILFSCKSGGGDPKATLNNFFSALSKNDVANARKYATEDSKSMLDMMETGMKMSPEAKKENAKFIPDNMEFGEAKIEGDKATVTVKEKKSGESTTYTLKKEKGEWKVAFDKNSIMSIGMQKMGEKGINVSDSISNSADKINIDAIKADVDKAVKSLDSVK